MNRYRHPAMKQLADQQARYAPEKHKLQQLERAESFLASIDETKEYPYQFVCFKLTDYRPDTYPDLVLMGADLSHDLRLFIEDVSASANIAEVEVGEPVLSVEQVSQRYNVSTKTINRWRERGLVSRRFLTQGRKRIGFLQSSVDRFVKAHLAEVERGSRFSQLSVEEKDEIILRAKRMSQAPTATMAEVARRIAKKLGRSPETIRYTIKSYDRDHPDDAIFPAMRGPLDDVTRNNIYVSFRQGSSIDQLAERFHRTRSSVYRIVNEIRAERILSQPLEYMPHSSFDAPNAKLEILGPEPTCEPSKPARPPAGLPPYLQDLYEIPLLSKDLEQYLFRKMNYLLHLAKLEREKVIVHSAKTSQLERIEKYQDEAQEIKRRLIRANLRLVVSIAKRHVTPNATLFELVSDGNISLIRAVEKFDFSRGFKFSTYASWAIMKNYARTIPAESTIRDRFSTGHEEEFDNTPDLRSQPTDDLRARERIQGAIASLLDRLEDRERKILVCRYGLGESGEPQTLEQVGDKFGVTKERIRQIEARAITKLKQYAEAESLDFSLLS